MSKAKSEQVYALSRPSRCYGCDSKLAINDIVKLNKKQDETEAYCLVCADLNDFQFLKKGNAKVTRLAKKYSQDHYVVVKWSELWKTYERQGLLVQSKALERAVQEAKSASS